MPVDAWEKRCVAPEGSLDGQEVVLLERCDDDANSWWAFHVHEGAPVFARLNLRRYGGVKRGYGQPQNTNQATLRHLQFSTSEVMVACHPGQ